MAITYKWYVNGIHTVAQENGKTNVLKRLQWELRGTDGTYTESVTRGNGFIDFAPVSDGAFKPYQDLTETEIAAWLDQNVPDQAALRAELDQKIQDNYLQPLSTTMSPWDLKKTMAG